MSKNSQFRNLKHLAIKENGERDLALKWIKTGRGKLDETIYCHGSVWEEEMKEITIIGRTGNKTIERFPER